jgi:hypothetical protein
MVPAKRPYFLQKYINSNSGGGMLRFLSRQSRQMLDATRHRVSIQLRRQSVSVASLVASILACKGKVPQLKFRVAPVGNMPGLLDLGRA